jgi:uncharacterized protein (DUF58 family)|tara:strand:- start:118 stop:990 length:873 start_codon:yes stop_codon:yes gene_type:complete
METKELLKKVRKIEIKTKGLSNQIFSGEYHSAFKGRGMTFSEVREYAHGDEIRTIDWNVTARFGTPHVKVFEEERELTVMLLVDVSGSQYVGSEAQMKRELIAEICAVISFSAIQNNDKIGALFFTDKTELFIPPGKGKKHILRIIRELIELKPTSEKTDIPDALRHYTNVIKKRSIGFLLSDFKTNNKQELEKSLKITNKRHDLVAVKVKDKNEEELPNIGFVKFEDLESKMTKWVNTSSRKVRKDYKIKALKEESEIKEILKKSGVDFTTVETNKSYIKPLMDLFKHR